VQVSNLIVMSGIAHRTGVRRKCRAIAVATKWLFSRRHYSAADIPDLSLLNELRREQTHIRRGE
jgi:hypothetical protein